MRRALATMALAAVCLLQITVKSQEAVRLPGGLTSDSSVKELLEWLDKSSFAGAWIGLNNVGYNYSSSYQDGYRVLPASQESFNVYFSQGFKLANLVGCMVTLRNDDIQLLSPETDKLSQNFAPHIGELYIPLHRLDAKKGKNTHRWTSDAEKGKAYGVWRTTYRSGGFYSKRVFGTSIFPPNRRDLQGYLDADTVTFTFESKQMSDEFDVVFRQAIRRCKPR